MRKLYSFSFLILNFETDFLMLWNSKTIVLEFKIKTLKNPFQSSFFFLHQTFRRQLPSFSNYSQCFWEKSPFLLICDVQTAHSDEQTRTYNEHAENGFIDNPLPANNLLMTIERKYPNLADIPAVVYEKKGQRS